MLSTKMDIFPSKSIYDVAINIPSTIGKNFTGPADASTKASSNLFEVLAT